MKRPSFWPSRSSSLVRWVRRVFFEGGMTAIITWADGVISVAGPPIMSDCSASGCAVMSGLLSEGSPSHVTDGLNNLSKKMLGGDCISFCSDACQDVRCLIIFPGDVVKLQSLEPS